MPGAPLCGQIWAAPAILEEMVPIMVFKDNEDEELCSVFVPTNHLYIGDIFLVNSKDIIRPNLSIREGIEIIVSGGMTMPQLITPVERATRPNERISLNRIG
ncbi:hypothetical protein V8G54_008335 [Vigna mungo]|uniref:Uncharacterized protein n=1 Tax=Vigna mungo TaxID=3915 RepID=A0AAQ3P418_VIGMU